MARRSSTRWLLRCGGFLGLVLLANGAAQWLGLGYWQPFVNNQAQKIYVYQRDGLSPDVLFLGTSKVNRAVIQAVVGADQSNSFCLGQMGVSAQTQAIVLRDVLESNGCPRLVVLEVTPGMLNANHGGFTDVLRHYASPGDLVRAVPRLRSAAQWRAAGQGAFRGLTSLYLRSWCVLFRGGLQRQLDSIRRLRGGHYGPMVTRGLEGLDKMRPAEQRDLLRRMSDKGRRRFMHRFAIGGAAAEGLEEIIRLARNRGVGLALFNPPVTPEYRRALYQPGEYARFLEYVERIARREGIPFLDLDDGRLGLTSADFFDFGHLNAAGAEKASHCLVRDLLVPALAAPPVPGTAAGDRKNGT